MTDQPTVEAEVEELPAVDEPAPTPGVTVARRERRSEVIRPLDLTQVKGSMEAYQQGLHALLDTDDWQGRPGAKGSFVKKSGWRKIATWFDLDVEPIPGMSKVERDDNGQPVRAEVWVRAVAPSGRSFVGDGYCSVEESRFARESGRQKLENDLRATATTRAVNRAISNLVGMGAVSAEEVGSKPEVEGPAYGPAMTPNVGKAVGAALLALLGGDAEKGRAANAMVKRELGYVPHAAAVAILEIGRAHV